MKRAAILAVAVVWLPVAYGCDKLTTSWAGAPQSANGPGGGQSTAKPPVTGVPIDALGLDAGELSDLAQAKEYRRSGQVWMARMLVEKKALSPAGSKEEAQFLAEICQDQGDAACIEACNKKLGTKLKVAGNKWDASGTSDLPPGIPDDDLAKARDAVHRGDKKKARAILEPRILENKASHDEVQLLHELCRLENDKMCMAMCKTRL